MFGAALHDEEARRAEQAGLAQFHPVLAEMTPEEFDRYVDETVRSEQSSPAGRSAVMSDTIARVLSTLAVVAAGACGFLASSIVLKLWGGSFTIPPPVTIGVVTLGAIFAAQAAARRYHRRWARRTRVLAVRARMLRQSHRCAGCRYDLASVAAMEDRKDVVQCPECGLVNPAIQDEPPAVASAPGPSTSPARV